MSNKPTAKMRRRLFCVVGLALVVFAVYIVTNIIGIAISDNQKYQQLANNQQFTSRTINANRGSIKDINGQILAQSATVYNIFIDPVTYKKFDEDNRELIISTLVEILEIKRESIESKLDKNTGYEILKRKVDKIVADKIINFTSENGIACIGADPDTKRFYPQNDLAASVIGFTNYDGIGIYGLEKQYNEYLTGVNGRIVSAKDAMGNQAPYRYEESIAAEDGNTLILNIDVVLQHYVEKELQKAVFSNEARNRSCAIVMNAKTGQILAMATAPGFDLNDPREITDPKVAEYLETLEGEELTKQTAIAWEKQWKNKAITELYNPGSVFKVITGSAALEEKVIDPKETLFSCNGGVTISGQHINCWKTEGHGTQDFVKAMTNSCNPAFVEIGQRLGVQKFSEYFRGFGIDGRTGIDLPGEGTSIYRDEEIMTKLDLAVSSFGQSIKITPLEMITAYAAVVNGGNVVTPYVVDKILDSEDNVVTQFEPEIKRQIISEETSKIMRETLESVVVTNGGSNAYIQGYKIGGKSGTSQKIDEYGPVEGKEIYVSSYVGFAPADDPEIIMLVMVDEPMGGKYFGSLVAAPVVSSVFEEALPYLGYFKEYTDEEYAKLNVTVPSVTGRPLESASSTLSALSLDVEVIGEGTTVLKQIPASSSTMPRNGKIYLYTEESEPQMVNIPNVANMSLQEANKAITNAGLNFMATGGAANSPGAYAISQSQYGVKVAKGSVIEVKFVTNDETG